MHVCPTCGARDNQPCTSFEMIGPGDRGPRYDLAEPHVWRPLAETYWHAIDIRLALIEGRTT